jgi:hypothetical protein
MFLVCQVHMDFYSVCFEDIAKMVFCTQFIRFLSRLKSNSSLNILANLHEELTQVWV